MTGILGCLKALQSPRKATGVNTGEPTSSIKEPTSCQTTSSQQAANFQ